ncbi:Variable outer membrane protein [Borrelia duttonii CR2A]|uniref:Variable large protein n=1 Tax=Borrelia duttonii CR2A TaxID=1432657 RepID=W6TJ16_9SPIR|nr:Variable outer membrane protein [Borrelia duttonii CR2A]
MIKNDGVATKFAKNNDGNAGAVPKDAEVAGGIALRSMAKGGKFAGPSDNASADAKKVVEGAAVSAVTKALDTLTVAIRKAIDEGLKGVKEAIKINVNATPVVSE